MRISESWPMQRSSRRNKISRTGLLWGRRLDGIRRFDQGLSYFGRRQDILAG